MDTEPTIIIKSLKDFNQFLYSNMEAQKQDDTQPNSNFGNVSRLKLSFSDSVCSVDSIDGSSINLKLADSVTFNYDESVLEPSFSEKHQNTITGFDVSQRLRNKHKEIIEGKTKISLLESKAGNFQALNKKMSIQYEKEIETLRKDNMEVREQATELKRQTKLLEKTEADLREKMLNMTKSSDEKIYGVEKKFYVSQEAHMKELNGLWEEREKLRNVVAKLQNESEESKFKINVNEEEKNHLEEKLKQISNNVSCSELLQHEVDTLKFQLSKSELSNKELNIRLDSLKESESKKQLLDKSLIRLSALEKEILKLKDENDTYKISALNIALLEEKLSSAEKEVEVLKTRCKNLTEENVTLITLRNLSDQCESVIREELKLEYSPSPAELKDILSDLCSCDSDLKNSVDELKSSVKSHEVFRENQEALLAKFSSEIESKVNKINRDGQLMRRLQRKLLMISKERDGLKDIISSYESESTLNISALEKQRIQSLESQLTAYKQELSRLESEFGQPISPNSNSPLKNGDSKLTDKIVGLEKKVVELEELKEILIEEKEALEVRISTQLPQGTFDQRTTKVVQLVNNPLTESHNEKKQLIEHLKKENNSLKCRLKLIDEGEQLNLTQKVETNVDSNKYIQELKEKIESAELRNKRLLEVFKKKSYDLREVIYRLIGYRVDVGTDSKYKLINIYSPSQAEFLLFEQTANGDLQMLQTDFSFNLEELMEEYLENMNSYPAFLSAVTLHLLSKSNIQEHPSDDDDLPSDADDQLSDGDEPNSDDPPSECENPLSDCENPPSDCDNQPSECDNPPSDDDEQPSDVDDQLSDIDDQPSECDEQSDGEEEEEERPAKRLKIDDDDDDLICLD